MKISCIPDTEGCRPFRLRAATLTIGYFDLILSLYLGPIVKAAAKLQLTEDITLKDLLQDLDAVGYWFLLCAALDVFLLIGTHKYRRNLMLPYIAVNGCGILAVSVLSVQYLARGSSNMVENLNFAISSLLSLGALTFTWFIVVSFFKQIQGKKIDSEDKTTQS
ncbi:hypothetical protein C0J52_00191 [Blattella germanica]|nr:hypothetical protein C0J52_00191 [Blattella germanica]